MRWSGETGWVDESTTRPGEMVELQQNRGVPHYLRRDQCARRQVEPCVCVACVFFTRVVSPLQQAAGIISSYPLLPYRRTDTKTMRLTGALSAVGAALCAAQIVSCSVG